MNEGDKEKTIIVHQTDLRTLFKPFKWIVITLAICIFLYNNNLSYNSIRFKLGKKINVLEKRVDILQNHATILTKIYSKEISFFDDKKKILRFYSFAFPISDSTKNEVVHIRISERRMPKKLKRYIRQNLFGIMELDEDNLNNASIAGIYGFEPEQILSLTKKMNSIKAQGGR